MSEGDGMANIERWRILKESGVVGSNRPAHVDVGGPPTKGWVEVVRADTYRGAVEERDALREKVDQLEQDLAASRIGPWVEPPNPGGQ